MQLIEFYREISAGIRRDLEKQKKLLPLDSIQELCAAHHRQHRSLKQALVDHSGKGVIAGLQKNYPREGWNCGTFDHLAFAQSCEKAGAVALACNTEKNFFGGNPSMLTGITHLVKTPVIRWDFLLDAYQIMQTRLWGADAARIVIRMLDNLELDTILKNASQHNIEIIAEASGIDDIDRLMAAEQSSAAAAILIGEDVTDSDEFAQMLAKIPHGIPALFAGDNYSFDEIRLVNANGVTLFRKLMHDPDLGKTIAQIR